MATKISVRRVEGGKNVSERLWRWLDERVLSFQGSTRPVALMRILLVFIIWTKFASGMRAFSHLEPVSIVVGILFFLGSTAMLLGWKTEWATGFTGALLMFVYYYFGYGRGHSVWVHHHVYLLAVSTCVLALTPCGKSWSMDRLESVRRAEEQGVDPPLEVGPLWATRILGFQVSMVYFWGAVDKTEWVFLDGTRMQQSAMYLFFGSDYPPFPGFAAFMALTAVIVVGLEYVLAIGLWIPRFQRVLIPTGLLLHALFYYLIPVATFSVTMAVLYIAYLDPAIIAKLTDRMAGKRSGSDPINPGKPDLGQTPNA